MEGAHVIPDDRILATKTEEEHDLLIKEVLGLIRKNGMTLNPEKCFLSRGIYHFGGW